MRFLGGALLIAFAIQFAEPAKADIASTCGPDSRCWLHAAVNAIDAKDFQDAREDFSVSAKLGSTDAEYGLAVLYGDAKSGMFNISSSSYWLMKAAKDGVTPAQILLATYYLKGRSPIPKDWVEAYKWFSIAAATASDDGQRSDAEHARDAVAQALTPQQLADGRARAFRQSAN